MLMLIINIVSVKRYIINLNTSNVNVNPKE